MNKRTRATGGLVMALGLGAGCGGVTPAMKSDPQQVDASIEQSRARLSHLKIMYVGGMVSSLPAEAMACYGVPCPGSSWLAPWQEERAHQAARLEGLVAIAERVAGDERIQPADPDGAAAAAAALAKLQIVQVEALVQEKPANNAQCYNLPCDSDVAAAAQHNGLQVARAQAIADAATKSGL